MRVAKVPVGVEKATSCDPPVLGHIPHVDDELRDVADDEDQHNGHESENSVLWVIRHVSKLLFKKKLSEDF